MKTEKEAIKEIQYAIEKNVEAIPNSDFLNSCLSDIDNRLYTIALDEKYGIKVPSHNRVNKSWMEVGNCMHIGVFGESQNRTISWSDDGEQPEDGERLLRVSFPTGAYVFGEDYPIELFKQFFVELKAYSPKYSDTNNNALYFSMSEAGKIFKELPVKIEEYYSKSKEQWKKREAQRLREKADELEGKND